MYQEFTSRNIGYISNELQAHISQTTLLIAGCGIGSVVAEAALRTGFTKLILVDADTVSLSNLNRQAYSFHHIDKSKVHSLKDHLMSIYPKAEITVYHQWLSEDNVKEIVDQADIILDTIDFLDLKAIFALHDYANATFKPILSAFSCAWGAFSAVFMPGCMTLKEFIDYDEHTDHDMDIVAVFTRMLQRFSDRLPPEFMQVTAEVFHKLQSGISCPAPQMSIGANCVAAVMVTQVIRVLNNQKIKIAPEVSIVNLHDMIV